VTLAIPDFSSASIVVAGDVMLDRYLFGGTGRISPEAPVPVVHVRETESRAGGAANVAVNLVALGIATTLVGVVGQDEEAAALRSVLEQQDIECRFKAVKNWPTTTKTRVQSRGQQLIRLDREELDASGSDALTGLLQKELKSATAVILSDYAKGALASVSDMIELCRNANIPVLVDPKGTSFDKYRGATVLTPNQRSLSAPGT
jgi:D-beta-D-heptose 7-phosphate kinase/D-beta-D-heptose 1-phosphate adenosyltransferase